jgi:hypothetical protein
MEREWSWKIIESPWKCLPTLGYDSYFKVVTHSVCELGGAMCKVCACVKTRCVVLKT